MPAPDRAVVLGRIHSVLEFLFAVNPTITFIRITILNPSQIIRKCKGNNQEAMFIQNFVKSHPLACVLIVALLLRLIATTWSKGFMAVDDHYSTVGVSYGWLQYGFIGTDGHLLWGKTPSSEISRFPLYSLSLYVQMRLFLLAGVDSLDTMMYGIRLVHALLSLLLVWCSFQIIMLSTKSWRWALFGGLFAAVHFAMPYLSVRTIIEMVGGHFWLLALWFLYRYRNDNRVRHLFWAGIITGLAWMIRFQIAFAAIAVPFALWWITGRIRPAGIYVLGVSIMILAAGLADYWLLGKFMASNINHLFGGVQSIGDPPIYKTSIFIYLTVIAAFFIPPFSIFALGLCFARKLWRAHAALILSTVSFVAFHYLTTNRQERFMIPIIGPLLVLIVIAIHHHYESNGFWFRHRRLAGAIVISALAVNFALLPIFTIRYGHKAEVEPLVQIEKNNKLASVLFVDPETKRIFPLGYGGYDGIGRDYVYSWNDFANLEQIRPDIRFYDYYVLYPSSHAGLPEMIDSLTNRYGPVEQFSYISPSLVDSWLYALNPRNVKSPQAWVYCPRVSVK